MERPYCPHELLSASSRPVDKLRVVTLRVLEVVLEMAFQAGAVNAVRAFPTIPGTASVVRPLRALAILLSLQARNVPFLNLKRCGQAMAALTPSIWGVCPPLE